MSAPAVNAPPVRATGFSPATGVRFTIVMAPKDTPAISATNAPNTICPPWPMLPPTSNASPTSDTTSATRDRAGGRARVTTASYTATTTGAEPMPTNVASPTDASVTEVKNAYSKAAVSAPVTTMRNHMARVHSPGWRRPTTASASSNDTPASPMRHAAIPTG